MSNLIELVVTPPAGASARALDALPAIRHAFARRPVPVVSAATCEYWFRRFAVERQHDWPAAAFRTVGPHARFQLCADPVHLAVNGDAVTLDATASADLSQEDALSLIAHLNAHFAADGARFAFEGFRTLVGKSDSLRRLEPLMVHARKRIGEMVGDDVTQTLGFDPLAVLRALLRR